MDQVDGDVIKVSNESPRKLMSAERLLQSPTFTWASIPVVLVIYALFYPVTQPDHFKFLLPWLRAISASDGLAIFATDFSNYTGGYISVLWASTALNPLLSELAIIKLTSVIGSGLAALGVGLCLTAVGWSICASINAGLAFLLLPTVMLNGIGWGQADAFFTAFTLYSVAAILRNRPLMAGVMFAIALSFKLQAIFFAPFLLGYLLRTPRNIVILTICFVPIYLIVNAIHLLGGRAVTDVLSIYLGQAQTFTRLSMNAANLWYLVDVFVPEENLVRYSSVFLSVGIAAASLVGVWIAWVVYRLSMTAQSVLFFACLCLVLMPFLLPKMHDRFFFPAEALLFVAALIDRRLLPAAILAQISGIAMYSIYHDTLGLREIIGPVIALLGIAMMLFCLSSLLGQLKDRSA